MKKILLDNLSRRERQIMDIVYKLGKVTALDVQNNMPDAPSYSAVRTFLRILEEKQLLKHQQDGARYVYLPRVNHEQARRSAIKNLLQTFFNGSAESAVATLLDISKSDLTPEDFDRMMLLIDKAKKEGK
jgi:predicted transcriptional regulator